MNSKLSTPALSYDHGSSFHYDHNSGHDDVLTDGTRQGSVRTSCNITVEGLTIIVSYYLSGLGGYL
jgi:hypothetical protein